VWSLEVMASLHLQFSGIHGNGKRFSYIEIQGVAPGKTRQDGPDGQDLHLGRFMNTP
jgi:hypothetical protein